MQTTKFLDGLSGKLAERWVANLLTPAFVFWAGGFVAGILKFGWQDFYTALNQLSEPQQIALLIFSLLIVVTSAFVIERFDFGVLRLLEGYWPRWLRPLRRWLIKQQHKHNTKAETKWNKLFAKRETQGLTPDEEEDLAQLEAELKRFPAKAQKLMPTRLGNLLRAVELRPFDKYGLDAVLCWSHLWLLLPEHTRSDLAQARGHLNTAVRTWLWSIFFWVWCIWTIWAFPIGLLSALFAYRWALDAAGTYADLLEATFDLYRFDLYRALQFPLPTSQQEEKIIAAQLNQYLQRGYVNQDFRYILPNSTSGNS